MTKAPSPATTYGVGPLTINCPQGNNSGSVEAKITNPNPATHSMTNFPQLEVENPQGSGSWMYVASMSLKSGSSDVYEGDFWPWHLDAHGKAEFRVVVGWMVYYQFTESNAKTANC